VTITDLWLAARMGWAECEEALLDLAADGRAELVAIAHPDRHQHRRFVELAGERFHGVRLTD